MPEILRGRLDRISLASVLQLADGEAFDGWLLVDGATRIGCRAGSIISAELGVLRGRQAVRELFLVRKGRFALELTKAPGTEQPIGSTMGLVMDGCRIADEWHRLAAMVLEVIEVDRSGLTDPTRAVVARLDGTRCTLEAVLEVGCPSSAVVDELLSLLESGSVAEVAPPKHDLVERLSAGDAERIQPDVTEGVDFHQALELGRAALKARDFPRAEAFFLEALNVRPGDRIANQNLRRVRQLRASAT